MDIKTLITNLYPISSKTLDDFCYHFTQKHLKKGTILFEADKIGRKVYILAQGAARAYCYQADREVTFWFGFEGDVLMSYYSYIANRAGYEYVSLLEDALVYEIGLDTLQRLYTEDIELANWGRKLAEYALVKTEERFVSLQFRTATERYQLLLEQNPELLYRVQLGYIASYIGVTQVTLSRIRANFGR